jgi:hypothetical protein
MCKEEALGSTCSRPALNLTLVPLSLDSMLDPVTPRPVYRGPFHELGDVTCRLTIS